MSYDRNYEEDSRVRAARNGDWYEAIDESSGIVVVRVYDEWVAGEKLEDGETLPEGVEEDGTAELPFVYEVCQICDGKGKHVNPSIDAGGISGEDFYADPDFAEEYMRGVYDVQCYGCGGKRVVPQIDEKKANPELVKLYQDRAEFEADFEAMCRAERRMGC